ncbi:MAG: hypothetical protein LBP22_08725 [Deltaproteobacteria bacterium]|jgi:hypothetical protein|nr:hypothetical protein [Deltaproteobacteria bacterium]
MAIRIDMEQARMVCATIEEKFRLEKRPTSVEEIQAWGSIKDKAMEQGLIYALALNLCWLEYGVVYPSNPIYWKWGASLEGIAKENDDLLAAVEKAGDAFFVNTGNAGKTEEIAPDKPKKKRGRPIKAVEAAVPKFEESVPDEVLMTVTDEDPFGNPLNLTM